jgi:hypothetical protein
LLTRVSPATRRPVDAGTTATPYGFTSPLAGTVEAICETECSWLRNGGAASCAAATLGFELLDPHAARTSPSDATSAAAGMAEMAGIAGTRSLTVLPFRKINDRYGRLDRYVDPRHETGYEQHKRLSRQASEVLSRTVTD